MRLPIAAKLALTVAVPLAVVFAASLVWNYRAAREMALRDIEDSIGARVDAEAQRLDAVFRELAALVDAAAVTLGTREELTGDEAFAVARGLVRQRPLAFGSAVAFAPRAGPGGERLFAPYAHRSSDSVVEMDIAGAYDYTDARWEWFAVPASTMRPVWTEPYFDKGAGGIIMCTYAAPFFFPDGSFRGVVTIDIPLARIQGVISDSIEGGRDGFIITTSRGTIVSSPHPDSIMHNILEDPRIAPGTPAREVVDGMLAGKTQISLITDFPEPGRHFLASAPIPGPDWRLGGRIPERVVMAPVYAVLRDQALSRLGVVVIALAGILMLSVRLVRPVKRLHEAVGRIATGDLGARVSGVERHDELGDLAVAFNSMAGRLGDQVEQLASEMAKREAVESDLRVAREIQASLLPREFPTEGAVGLFGVNAPARFVAGDFFDYVKTGDGAGLLFVIADVSGKGMPAAMLMAVTRTVFRNLAVQGDDPGTIVRALNTLLLADNDRGMFVTMFIGRYETGTGDLRYTNAGHPTPYLLRAGDSPRTVGEVTGTVVGAIDEAQFEEQTLRVEPGDRLVFFTDGVTEARAPDGSFFGEQGLADLLSRHGCEPIGSLCDSVCAALDRYQAGKRADDITLLVLEHREVGAR